MKPATQLPTKFNNNTLSEIMTLWAIKSFRNNTTKRCTPSYETISEITGVSTRTIKRNVAKLKDSQFTIITTSSKDHYGTVNNYNFEEMKENYCYISTAVLNSKNLSNDEKVFVYLLKTLCYKDTNECRLPKKSIYAELKNRGVKIGRQTTLDLISSLLKKRCITATENGFALPKELFVKPAGKNAKANFKILS